MAFTGVSLVGPPLRTCCTVRQHCSEHPFYVREGHLNLRGSLAPKIAIKRIIFAHRQVMPKLAA